MMQLPLDQAHVPSKAEPMPAVRLSILARSAWWRLLLVLPACLLLWLGVCWALAGEPG